MPNSILPSLHKLIALFPSHLNFSAQIKAKEKPWCSVKHKKIEVMLAEEVKLQTCQHLSCCISKEHTAVTVAQSVKVCLHASLMQYMQTTMTAKKALVQMVTFKEHGPILMSEAMDIRASNSEDWDHSGICIFMASSFTFSRCCIWDDLKRFEQRLAY